MSREEYQQNLLEWYHEHHRKLPWRETSDPYRIWLSEIMCQQTQVATVIPYYERFLQAYPTVLSLAKAEEDHIYKLWEGLGYYSRAKRLMLCAREVVDNYDGRFPDTYREMIKLPGIGPYTAGAILSIAFNKKEPAIDGNVMRVYSRIYNIFEDVGKPGAAKAFDPFVRADLPEDVCHFNQGLMELGARICTPTSPKCDECPVRGYCEARRLKIQETLPVKSKKPKKKHKTMAVIFIENQDQCMLEKRGTEGLLANLWGFPVVEMTNGFDDNAVRDHIEETYGLSVVYEGIISSKKHVFTHLIWEMTLYRYSCDKVVNIDEPETVWIDEKAIGDYPLPTAFLKLLPG